MVGQIGARRRASPQFQLRNRAWSPNHGLITGWRILAILSTPMKDMVGTRRLELLTSPVSRLASFMYLLELTVSSETAKDDVGRRRPPLLSLAAQRPSTLRGSYLTPKSRRFRLRQMLDVHPHQSVDSSPNLPTRDSRARRCWQAVCPGQGTRTSLFPIDRT